MKIHTLEVQASKDLEDKDKIISEKNIQLLEIEQQVEKLQVRNGKTCAIKIWSQTLSPQAEQTMTVLKMKEALTAISQKQVNHLL